MERSPFLPLPEGMIIDHVERTEAQLTVEVISLSPFARCPGCGSLSDSVHCHYQRKVHDVPCGGRRIVLHLCVRKFFCRVLTCRRKVFTERLPDLVQPWARVSNRLLEELKALGLAASAEVNERLAPRLAMSVKAPTLLRYLRTIPPPADTSVRVLGIDDFAMKRGDCYGTILVNIETGKPLNLLPDRTAEAVLPWLLQHQEIEVVSRDRASAYADAVKRALPHATQVADRYHLLQNLREHLQCLLDRKRTYLPCIEDTSLKGTQAGDTGSQAAPSLSRPKESPLFLKEVANACASNQSLPLHEPEHAMGLEKDLDLASLTYAERKKKISRDKRSACYQQIRTLHRAGKGQRAIARELHKSRKIVHRFLASDTFPERAPGSGVRPGGKSKLAPYLPYLHERWDAGTQSGSLLFGEIKEQGYTGSASLLRGVLSQWRTALPPQRKQGQPRKPRLEAKPTQRRLSSRSASFLMILSAEKLTATGRHHVEQMCQASDELRSIYLLSQEFITLLRERQAEALDEWLRSAKESQVAELISFVNGIRRDYAAVRAACSLPWSNGMVEGHVNRLKFLKRQMFGRAHLDLLRVKVLHAV